MAGAVAEALGAEKIIYLTDVEGLLADVDDPGSPHPPHDRRRARRPISTPAPSTGGMIPKLSACIARGRATASAARTSSTARVPHVVLLELFTDGGRAP